jgi:DNA integrity scanning protein DisA with diadenylate cyclase activity
MKPHRPSDGDHLLKDEAAITGVASAELIGTRPEREWEALQQSLVEMGGALARYRDCSEVEKVLDQVRSARGELDRLEQALESAHLACCILPGVPAPEELSQALARLASRGVGGLIVVEREQSLDEYLERGTPLDAQFSANLLESLFHPGSALHDGAVIVRGSRIMAAGVFLPVMGERRDPTHGRLLGGRHRAALALSRLTDALVFVVSEETREVSLAVHGLLHPGLPVAAQPDGSGSHSDSVEIRASGFDRLRSALGSLTRRRRGLNGPP